MFERYKLSNIRLRAYVIALVANRKSIRRQKMGKYLFVGFIKNESVFVWSRYHISPYWHNRNYSPYRLDI